MLQQQHLQGLPAEALSLGPLLWVHQQQEEILAAPVGPLQHRRSPLCLAVVPFSGHHQHILGAHAFLGPPQLLSLPALQAYLVLPAGSLLLLQGAAAAAVACVGSLMRVLAAAVCSGAAQ